MIQAEILKCLRAIMIILFPCQCGQWGIRESQRGELWNITFLSGSVPFRTLEAILWPLRKLASLETKSCFEYNRRAWVLNGNVGSPEFFKCDLPNAKHCLLSRKKMFYCLSLLLQLFIIGNWIYLHWHLIYNVEKYLAMCEQFKWMISIYFFPSN